MDADASTGPGPESARGRPTPASQRSIYGSFSLVLLVVMLVTLLPHYGEILDSSKAVPAYFVVHGILYLGWYLLFAVQSRLVARDHLALHRQLGSLSLVLFIALVASGCEMLLGVMRGFDSSWSDGYRFSRVSFVWGILHTLACFILFYVLGLCCRGRSQAHKRLMLMASLSMVSASVTRVAYLPGVPVDGTAVTLLTTYGLLIVPIVIDRRLSARVHPVLKWGVPLYIVTQVVCIVIMPTTDLGQSIAFPFRAS